MLSIADETTAFITAALRDDPALSSLAVVGTTPETLTATITPGKPPNRFGGSEWQPAAPFRREILIELVVRMQRRRWLRFDDFVLGMSPPNEEDWRQIKAVLGVSPEHGAGWHDLVLAGAHWIVELGGNPKTGQVKEKFGTMRWYHSGLVGDVGDEITDAAEHLSRRICEVCGAPGKNASHGGWWRTRCLEHEHE